MLGLASTLLYAIASQRGLLIEWPEIDGFSGDSYEALFEPAHDMPILLPQMLREWSLDYKSFTKMAVTLEVNNGHPAPYEALFCRNLSVAYSDAVFIVLSTNQFFAPAILYNKHHTQQVQGLLASPPPRAWLGGAWASTDGRQQVRGVGGEVSKKAAQELESAEEEVLASPYRFAPVFSPPPGHASPPPNNNANPPPDPPPAPAPASLPPPLFSSLLALVARPKAKIRKKIERFRKKHFDGKVSVGIQLRRQNRDGRDKKGAAISDLHVRTFFDCARARAEDAAEDALAHRRSAKSPAAGAGGDGLPGEADKREIVYFVASDFVPSREEARAYLGVGVVYWDEPISSTSQGMLNALVDMWLLGECQHLIVTSGSTFGYVAHARAAIKPWVVSLEKERGKHAWEHLPWLPPRCYEEATTEPCFHAWPFVMPQPCFSGGYDAALAEFGQSNCRPWDMEYFSFT